MKNNRWLINGRPSENELLLSELFHGASVFTTFRTKNFQPVWWDEHLARLLKHSRHFNFCQPSEAEFRKSFDILNANSQLDLKIRFTLSATNFIASAGGYEKPPTLIYDGVKVTWSDYFAHPQLAQFKTGNYLPYLLAHQKANLHGAFEALMCTEEGFLVDGSRTSPIFYLPGVIIVPTGGLHSITRSKVIAAAEKRGVEVKYLAVRRNNMPGQLLLASSTIGLVAVNKPLDCIVKDLINQFCPHVLPGRMTDGNS